MKRKREKMKKGIACLVLFMILMSTMPCTAIAGDASVDDLQDNYDLAFYGADIERVSIDVPFKVQVPPGSWPITKNCGQASSLMVFCYYWNTEPTVEDIKKIDNWLYEKYGDPINNYNGWETTTTKLKTLACEYANFPKSYKASGWNLEKLKQEIDAGHPVIVAIVAGKIPYRKKTDPDVIHYRNYKWEGGHFVVVKGYTSDCIICNDPATSLGDGKQYYNNDFKAAMDAQGGAVVVVIPSVILPLEAKPVLTSPLRITPEKDKYYVGDTIKAEFTIKNIGGAPITLDKLLVGGRFNGGMLPNGEYPDFTSQSTTLQPNGQYRYTGTLTLTQPGNYHFFIAYYIENPTSEEKKLLDGNNWNTCVDLGKGLTDADRIEDIRVFPQLEINVLSVPDDHPTIQAAVNAASAGDTIIVKDGIYYENVDVTKSLTIRSTSGNPANTIVQAKYPGDDVFYVTADYVNISGFTVEGATLPRAGICLLNSDYCNISSNKCSYNWRGIISLGYSSSNTITGNNVCNNRNGIYLFHSRNNTISGNDVSDNNYGGIFLGSSSDNTVSRNTFINDGLVVSESTYHNAVEDNTVNNKPLVYLEGASDYKVKDAGQVILINCRNIKVENLNLSNTCVGIELLATEDSIIADNTVSNNNWYGITLYSSSNNTISGNDVSGNNYVGISLVNYSSSNTITGNNVSGNNGDSISLWHSSNNTISGNDISGNNNTDIYRYSSSDNSIYLNNFINNNDNVYSYDSTNIWNSTEEITYTYKANQYTNYMGNYWNDYKGSDTNKDGIGDKSYSINSDKDNYPLMEHFENYIIEVEEPTEFLVAVSNPSGAYICNDSVAFTFSRNLKRGDSGDDVKYLQIVLNANPATQVAVEGPGSPCHETNYYGQLTEAAVIKFQTLHEGLTQTGEIDEATRAELNKLYLPVKHVPNGWVLNVTNTAQNEEIHDGCVWWEVEDVTDGIKGWVAYQKLSDTTKYLVIGDQDELKNRIMKLNTKEDRIPVILHAVTEPRTEFLPDNFPLGLILAMAIQESGGAGFDNEIVALTPWGRGIMQIDTPDHYVGAGSGIRGYNNGAVDYCRGKEGHGCTCSAGVCCCEACKHYYTNTIQGIEANIRDGLYVLSDKYNCRCCYDRSKNAGWDAEEGLYREEMGGEVIFYSRAEECKGGDGQTYDSRIEKIKIGSVRISCNEFKVIDAVWRYNGRSIYPDGSCMGNDYLRCVANRLNEIERTFGYEMTDKDTWIECLKAVSSSASVMKRIK